MKSCVVFILAIISTGYSLGSGPYLPSGWRPKGAAFLLPSEVEKTEVQQESNEETEAVGTEELREYGPPAPQDIFQSITKQALPDLYTEKAFAAENEDLGEEHNCFETESVSETVDIAEIPEVRSTETDTADIVVKTDDAEVIIEVTPAVVAENITEGSFENTSSDIEVSADVATPNEELETIQVTEQNFANDAVVSDELVILKVASESSKESVLEDVVEETNVSSNESEGVDRAFVGFREYGPPKRNLNEDASESKAIDANQIRKRRFSTKFLKKH
ncbi:unnamed protein product [Chilo suppressalis]|uniref:DUF4794 domain-containing protein n=1 Tax=Chilo suppressalis TaxID=168631 RepID=A0ABN8BBN7_CHISP|nr:unnamed protein product [Chilo suppressalis]